MQERIKLGSSAEHARELNRYDRAYPVAAHAWCEVQVQAALEPLLPEPVVGRYQPQ